MRTGRGLRMILHAEDGQFLVSHSLDSVVVQIDVADFDIFWQRLRIDCETVILGGDRNLATFQIFHRLVCATMTELQFEG